MIYKKQQFGTFNLHTIKTDKFKLCHVEIYFRNNVNVNDITKRNALFDVLFENNNEFKSRRLLNLKLEELDQTIKQLQTIIERNVEYEKNRSK